MTEVCAAAAAVITPAAAFVAAAVEITDSVAVKFPAAVAAAAVQITDSVAVVIAAAVVVVAAAVAVEVFAVEVAVLMGHSHLEKGVEVLCFRSGRYWLMRCKLFPQYVLDSWNELLVTLRSSVDLLNPLQVEQWM